MPGRFGRVLTAMVTPFHEDGSLDLVGAQRLADHLLANGTDTIVLAGTTGEAPTLTHEERRRLCEAVVEAAGGERVMAGTSTYSTAESIELTRAAEKAGVGSLLLVTPYYSRPPQSGLSAHFTGIASATDLPCMLYNIPSRAACTIETDTLVRLAGVENIVAVKDAVGDMVEASRLYRETAGALEIYSGDDKNLLPLLSVGGVGVVSVLAHLVGPQLAELVTAWEEGDPGAALDLHLRYLDLFEGLFRASNPILLKAALTELGLPSGPVRSPLVEATEDQRAFVRVLLSRHGLRPVRSAADRVRRSRERARDEVAVTTRLLQGELTARATARAEETDHD